MMRPNDSKLACDSKIQTEQPTTTYTGGWMTRNAALLRKVGGVLLKFQRQPFTLRRWLVAADAFDLADADAARALYEVGSYLVILHLNLIILARLGMACWRLARRRRKRKRKRKRNESLPKCSLRSAAAPPLSREKQDSRTHGVPAFRLAHAQLLPGASAGGGQVQGHCSGAAGPAGAGHSGGARRRRQPAALGRRLQHHTGGLGRGSGAVGTAVEVADRRCAMSRSTACCGRFRNPKPQTLKGFARNLEHDGRGRAVASMV